MFMRNVLFTILVLTGIILLPFIFRREAESLPATEERLVVVSAHNESVRYEFERGFREWYKKRHGKEVSIDWRSLGGTSEAMRYIRSTFTANFRHQWLSQSASNRWDDATAAGFLSYKTPLDGGENASLVRKAFLDSDVGIGIDVVFGGGQYDFNQLALAGMLVPCGVRERHPEWLEGKDAPLLQSGGGEIWYDPEDRYYGACFSCFGIIYNRDRLLQAGFSEEEADNFGKSWEHLADPRLYRSIGAADPTQSGSITKCFEMIIQRVMQDYLKGVESPAPEELDAAWSEALTVLKKLGGNASYLTFSASRVPMDAASGQIAAGMCIDYYGRSQAEWEEEHVGRKTIIYRTPAAGSSVSADPIGILRGAENRKLAEEFIDYVLSPEGQRLWGCRKGLPGGPLKYNLFRLPVRRDMYTAELCKDYCFPTDENPFVMAEHFIYRGAWTARLFSLMRVLVKVMIIDCGPELRSCWKEIINRGGLEACSVEQQQAFSALPFRHQESGSASKSLSTPEGQANVIRNWILFFQDNYRKAAAK